MRSADKQAAAAIAHVAGSGTPAAPNAEVVHAARAREADFAGRVQGAQVPEVLTGDIERARRL